MTNKNKLAELEALLFVHGEPVTIKKVASVLGVSQDETLQLLESYRETLRDESRGLILAFGSGGNHVQLVTKPELGSILEQFVKDELREDLSPASLETLSLVAYLGPVSRNTIEYVRGVNSSFILRTLLLRGLVERVPDPARAGYLRYAPSMECLRYLGINAQSDLPDFEQFRSSILAMADQMKSVESEGALQKQETSLSEGENIT